MFLIFNLISGTLIDNLSLYVTQKNAIHCLSDSLSDNFLSAGFFSDGFHSDNFDSDSFDSDGLDSDSFDSDSLDSDSFDSEGLDSDGFDESDPVVCLVQMSTIVGRSFLQTNSVL